MRYYITDRDDTPQHFPLRRLLRRVYEIEGSGVSTCEVLRSWGYGERVNQWATRLETADVLNVSLPEIDDVSEGIEEWFYWIDARVPGTSIHFGIWDSSAMFVDAPASVAEVICATFREVRRAP